MGIAVRPVHVRRRTLGQSAPPPWYVSIFGPGAVLSWEIAQTGTNATGVVTAAQKQAIVDQATAANIQAGADPATAAAQAQQIVTAALVSDNADPSQAGIGTMMEAPIDAATGQPLTTAPSLLNLLSPGTSGINYLLYGGLALGAYLILKK